MAGCHEHTHDKAVPPALGADLQLGDDFAETSSIYSLVQIYACYMRRTVACGHLGGSAIFMGSSNHVGNLNSNTFCSNQTVCTMKRVFIV